MSLARRIAKPAGAALVVVAAVLAGSPAYAGSSTVPVSPGNPCGRFDGNVHWSEDPITGGGYLHVWGQLRDTACQQGDNELWLAYHLANSGEKENYAIAYAYHGASPVDYQRTANGDNFSGISVTVCGTTNAGRWVCGSPAMV